MLANIIEKVSGKSFGRFLKDEIFKPLGMFQTGYYKSGEEPIYDLSTGYMPKDLYDVEPAVKLTGHPKQVMLQYTLLLVTLTNLE